MTDEIDVPDPHTSTAIRPLRKDELRRALYRNEFTLLYQPVISLGTDRIVGCEALLRWEHPEQGLISPTEFLPLVEESGLMEPIGRKVLEEACQDGARWCEYMRTGNGTGEAENGNGHRRHDHGGRDRAGNRNNDGSSREDFRLNVNLSVHQLQNSRFLRVVENTLDRTGLPPRTLQLEITESVLLQSMGLIPKLRDLGLRLAIDDFGTGYSSLRYLQDLEIDTLKVDGCFTRGIGRGEKAEHIVRTILLFAHGLGLEVVAEWIENRTQDRFLRKAGCDYVQGYLYSTPLPAELFEILLTRPRKGSPSGGFEEEET